MGGRILMVLTNMAKKHEIRNSTAEFLIFQAENKEQGIEVYYKDENVWCTQKAISTLFDCDRSVVTKHLSNVFESGELIEKQVCAKIAHTAKDGKTYNTKFYCLDAIIAVGYRVNSVRATQFRQWATAVLRQYAIRGYVLDRKRMENGTFLNEDYFEHLLAEIREIRLSERRFYQKLTDIYATSMDYNKDAPTTREFFKRIQNKMHYAVHGRTAAELIMERADADKEHMGLTTWECSGWQDCQDRCDDCQELPEADGTGRYGAHRDGSLRVCREPCQKAHTHDDGRLG